MPVSFDQLKGHKNCVTAIINHPLGIATGSEDKTVRLWDIRTNRSVKCIYGPIYDEVACLSQFPGNDNYICVGCDTSAMIFDIRNPQVIVKDVVFATTCNEDCVDRIRPAVIDGVNYLVICDDKGDIVLWNCDQNTEDIVIQAVHKTICSDIQVITSNEETLILSSGYDKFCHLTNLDGEALRTWHITPLSNSLPGVNPPFVTCLTCNPVDGRKYCGVMDGSVRYLMDSKDSILAQPVITTHTAGISDMQSFVRQNEHFILTTGSDSMFCIHRERKEIANLFEQKTSLEMRWKPNSFLVVGDDILFGGVSNQILRANGIFRLFFVCLYVASPYYTHFSLYIYFLYDTIYWENYKVYVFFDLTPVFSM